MASYLRNILFVFILFISFDAFGLREQGEGGLGNSNAGIYGILQLLFLGVLLVFMAFHFIFYRDIFLKDALSVAIHLLFLLFVVEFLASAMKSISGQYPFGGLMHNVYALKYYLVFFYITFWYRDAFSITEMFNTLLYAAVFSSSLFFIFVYVHEFPSLIQKLPSEELGRELRFVLPTSMLMAFGVCYQIAKFVYKKITVLGIAITLLLFWGVFIQMHRNVHLGLLALGAALFHQFFLRRVRLGYRIALYSIVGVVLVYYLSSIINKENSVVAMTVNEVTNASGNIGIRMALLANSSVYVYHNAPLLGIGYLWEDFDFTSMVRTLLVLAPTNDNSYTNILIVFGFFGIVIYTYLIATMFKSLSRVSKTVNPDIQVLHLTIKLVLIFILVSGFGTDNFMTYNSVVMFVILFSALNSINNYLYAEK